MKTNPLLVNPRYVIPQTPSPSGIFRALALASALWTVTDCQAQTTIVQNNLIQNGGFDSGDASWSTSGGGAYFYAQGSDTILSLGWWDGCSFWQNTGATIQPDSDYLLTVRAKVGGSPVTGVQLSFQDVTAGWTVVTNQDFTFPDQTTTWRIFSLQISSNELSSIVGNTIGVGGRLNENPNTQYGWLWVDWLQLAPVIPFVTAQPQGASNFAGASASLVASVVGAVTNATGPGSTLQYQWYKAPETPVANATNSSLAFPVLNATNGGDYYLMATNSFGFVRSSNATLVVLPANPPIIVTPPQSQTAYVYQSAQFAVTVSGTPPFSYQWVSNTTAIVGATNATLTLNHISAASAGTYHVVITNAFGSASTNAELAVITPAPGSYEAAAIDLQPLVYLRFSDIDTTNFVLNEGTLGTAADSLAEGGYSGTDGPLPPSYPNFESTNRSVQFNNLDTDVRIPPLNLSTNAGNTVTLAAWVYTYGPQANYAGIVFERGGAGSSASGLDVHADATTGLNTLAYHWADGYWSYDSGLILPDYQWCFVALVVTPTNATLFLRDGNGMTSRVSTGTHSPCAFGGTTYVGFDSDGNAAQRRFYGLIDEVTVFDRSLSATEVNELYSAAVGAPPEIVTNPNGVTNYTGQSFQLSAVASGAPPLHFQWRQNGAVIAGATNGTYAVASAATTHSGSYDLVVQNTAGAVTSEVAIVSILISAPILTASPASTNVWAGVPISLSGAAKGSAPLSYEWFKNGTRLTGQTNSTLVILDPEAGDDADYVLRVSNTFGQTNSPSAHLTVLNPAQADQMLYSLEGATYTLRSNYPPIQGVWFQTGAKSRVVTHLAYFDASGLGLLTNHSVGIYQGAPGAGTLLASVEVPAGNAPQYVNGFRWVPLSTPFTLQANTNYVLAASENDLDAWPDAFVPQWNSAYVGATAAGTRYPMWDWPYQAWPHEPGSTGQGWGDNATYGIFNLGSFPMTLQRAGANYQIHWTMGVLQSSTNVVGPYDNVVGATSPYTMPLTGPGRYYRLRLQ